MKSVQEMLKGDNVAERQATLYALRIAEALDLASKYGQDAGAHHKAWVIDQMVRTLIGNEDDYNTWVRRYKAKDYKTGEYEYDWDEGIAP